MTFSSPSVIDSGSTSLESHLRTRPLMFSTVPCSLDDLANELYPSESYPEPAEMTVETWAERSSLRYDIIRPLCWLGLLHEERKGLTIWQHGTYHKTPLWPACLKLESDMHSEFILH